MTAKIKSWGQTVRIHAPTEILKCRICGQEYFSRGKHDIGICRECEDKKKANLIGGPCNGEPAHDKS